MYLLLELPGLAKEAHSVCPPAGHSAVGVQPIVIYAMSLRLDDRERIQLLLLKVATATAQHNCSRRNRPFCVSCYMQVGQVEIIGENRYVIERICSFLSLIFTHWCCCRQYPKPYSGYFILNEMK